MRFEQDPWLLPGIRESAFIMSLPDSITGTGLKRASDSSIPKAPTFPYLTQLWHAALDLEYYQSVRTRRAGGDPPFRSCITPHYIERFIHGSRTRDA